MVLEDLMAGGGGIVLFGLLIFGAVLTLFFVPYILYRIRTISSEIQETQKHMLYYLQKIDGHMEKGLWVRPIRKVRPRKEVWEKDRI